ncbi:MAG: O-antigen ligase family protein [Bacteroidetes bacterium]|nr:O-antigen ligase family protein [Bacteroidota bacterium]
MALIFLLSLISISSHNHPKSFFKGGISISIIIFFLYQLISILLSENLKDGFAILLLRLPLFILPLSFCFIEFEKKIWDKILLFYAVITTIASVIGFSYGIYISISEKDTGYMYNDGISEILGKQAVYFSFHIAVALMVFIIQGKEYPLIVQKYRPFIYSAIFWLLFILFMLASRVAMFGVLIIVSLYILKVSVEKRKFFEVILFAFSLVIGLVIISKVFPKTLNRFKGATEINFKYDNKNIENHFNEEYDASKWNGTNTRAAIWTCAIEIWKTQPILGTGLGDRNKSLMKKYKENKFWYALGSDKNTHNQYLDVLLSMGTVGLIVFVMCFFIYPLKVFLKEKQIFAISVYVLLTICFITENMLDRYQGLIFIAFILPLAAKIDSKSPEL